MLSSSDGGASENKESGSLGSGDIGGNSGHATMVNNDMGNSAP